MDHQANDPQHDTRPSAVSSRVLESARALGRAPSSRALDDPYAAVSWGLERRVNAWRDLVVLSHLRWDLKVGSWIAWAFGEEPSVQIREDLQRFKDYIERGDRPEGAAREC
jgi:hypothetical protein